MCNWSFENRIMPEDRINKVIVPLYKGKGKYKTTQVLVCCVVGKVYGRIRNTSVVLRQVAELFKIQQTQGCVMSLVV